jgi:hypothetical protein
MSLQISLPLGNKGGVKNLVFTILTHEYPLKLIQLTNFIRKRYGKQVTFQAVRKAVLELIEEGVLVREENSFLINKEWIVESKRIIDELYTEIYQEKSKPKKFDSINDEISVFTFSSLNEMMKFWEGLIIHWFKNFKKGDDNVNCYQGAHGWEGILHPDTEKRMMEQLKDKGIKSYALFTSNTQLDRIIANFYKQAGVRSLISKSSSKFDKTYYVATYGNLIVQTQYPKELTERLDIFFKKNRKLENLDLGVLSDIVNKKIEIKLSVTKNIAMAKQINQSIIGQM